MKQQLSTHSGSASSNLTPSQWLIWAGQEKSPAVPLYNMALQYQIEAPLDPAIFAQAFQHVVDQSDAMRTVFKVVDGVPHRHVLDELQAEVHTIDARNAPSPKAFAEEVLQARCERPFDLESILFDTALVQTADDQFLWYFNQHHLVTDAWSFGLIYKQVSAAYQRLCDGKPLIDPDEAGQNASPQFESYARRLAKLTVPTKTSEFWRDHIRNRPARAQLFGEPLDPSTATDRLPFRLDADEVSALRELINKPAFRMLTPHMSRCCVIATALFAFLYRVSGQQSLSIGLPAHNRTTPEDKDTIGLFIELYPMTVEIERGENFASLYRKVQRSLTDSLLHCRPGACTPELHQGISVVLNYITAAFGPFSGHPMESTWLHPSHGDPAHDIRLQVHDFDDNGDVQIHLDVKQKLLEQYPRGAAFFMVLLRNLLSSPESKIDTIPYHMPLSLELFACKEPIRWQQTQSNTTLFTLFSAQAQKTPDQTAVSIGDRAYSFAEVHELVERLAKHLHAKGVQAGTHVAVCMRRSPELIVSLLAITRLGGVWIPMNPYHPLSRLQHILTDTDAKLVLTQQESDVQFPENIHTEPVSFDSLPSPTSGVPHYEPKATDPAYILYTSGSTGTPKGVVVPHEGICNYVTWAGLFYGGPGGEHWPLKFPFFTSLTFDLTLTSVFVPLATGGEVIVYPEKSANAELALLDVIADNRANIIKLTPSHMSMLSDTDLANSKLRQWILGGENLRLETARKIVVQTATKATVHNEYGPTEASVGCVVHTFEPDADQSASVPIGRAIPGMAAWVLNEEFVPCPEGVPGELFLLGAGLATAYHNQPALTTEKFVDITVGNNYRAYRTGDLARLRTDGIIEYLGRKDRQIKVRGVRIEPGEIEAAILQIEGIESCVVDLYSESESRINEPTAFCVQCGLPSNYPDVTFSSHGVCNQCQSFANWQSKAASYFQSMEALKSLFASSPNQGVYDCLALLSGGKDSTFALCQLVDLGLNVLAFTLDNGYISDEAKANIDRVVETLGVDHVYGTTPAMNAIFVDSLKRHANVCHGCFKTIYTLSTKLAKERNIPFIVTGLSRGQFFETRLTEELFQSDNLEPEQIDATILNARKAYHRVDDAVSQLLEVKELQQDEIFEQIRYVDFYRYCDVELDEMLAYLANRVPWIRPSDTGRSTNCLINDVGIHVHKIRKGFHNYAFPYAWDVRMGHKSRDAALDELDDDIDEAAVERILDEIGFDQPLVPDESPKLAAWFSTSRTIHPAEIHAHLKTQLPRNAIPTHYEEIEQLPLSSNGKVAMDRLPKPSALPTHIQADGNVPLNPKTKREQILAEIWCDVLNVPSITGNEHFLDLGGDSIRAIQVVGRAKRAGLTVTLDQLFETSNLVELAEQAKETGTLRANQSVVTGPVPLTPIQAWFFSQPLTNPDHWFQHLNVTLARSVPADWIERAFHAVVMHHDALRLRFEQMGTNWQATNESEVTSPLVRTLEPNADSQSRDEEQRPLDIRAGRLVDIIYTADLRELSIAVHHLAMDALSWPILLQDFDLALKAIETGTSISLPRKTTSFQEWATSREISASSTTSPPIIVHRQLPTNDSSESWGQEDSHDSQRTLTTELAPSQTEQIQRYCTNRKVRVHELLIASLSKAINSTTKTKLVHLDVETHGRDAPGDDFDLSRTIGWFTDILAVKIHAGQDRRLDDVVAQVHDDLATSTSTARQPKSTQSSLSSSGVQSDVLFNYLGDLGQLFPQLDTIRSTAPLRLSRGFNRSTYVLECNAMIVEQRLQLYFSFFERDVQPSLVQELLDNSVHHLEHILASNSGTKSKDVQDFPLARMNPEKLSKLDQLLKKADGANRK